MYALQTMFTHSNPLNGRLSKEFQNPWAFYEFKGVSKHYGDGRKKSLQPRSLNNIDLDIEDGRVRRHRRLLRLR